MNTLDAPFQEAKAGATVMSFNIWLRPRDSWNASIIDRGPGAGIYTTDPSCTSPQVPGTTATVTVAADGSGTLAAAGLIETESVQGPTPDPDARVDLAYRWTCNPAVNG